MHIERSTDGGRTWAKIGQGLLSDDIHGVAVVPEDGRRRLFATTNKGLHLSLDDGATWTMQPLDSPWQYTRTIVPRADGEGTVFLTNGDGPPGSTGRLLRSADRGRSWQDARLPGALNSTPWTIATHPADPSLMFVCSNLGQLFRSTDGGASWTRLAREFGEVRSTLVATASDATGDGAAGDVVGSGMVMPAWRSCSSRCAACSIRLLMRS